MLAGLAEYEALLGPHGLPVDETTSSEADPNNPDATYHYEAKVLRDWAQTAIEEREKDFKDHPSHARRFYAVRVDHSSK